MFFIERPYYTFPFMNQSYHSDPSSLEIMATSPFLGHNRIPLTVTRHNRKTSALTQSCGRKKCRASLLRVIVPCLSTMVVAIDNLLMLMSPEGTVSELPATLLICLKSARQLHIQKDLSIKTKQSRPSRFKGSSMASVISGGSLRTLSTLVD